jgi:hypothetical protein
MMEVDPRLQGADDDVDGYVQALVDELEIDAVGFWQIAPVGTSSFGLDGDALDAFIRRVLLALFDGGARPVVGRKGVDHWILKDDYGSDPAAVAEAIISEWRESGSKEPKPYDSLWFALPKFYEEPT